MVTLWTCLVISTQLQSFPSHWQSLWLYTYNKLWNTQEGPRIKKKATLFFNFSAAHFFFWIFLSLKHTFSLDVGHFKKSLLNLLQHCFCFIFWVFAMWDLNSPTRDQTCTPCSGRQNFNHRTTREVALLGVSFLLFSDPLESSFRRRQWQPTPVLLPGKSHGWRSLVDCIPWGR